MFDVFVQAFVYEIVFCISAEGRPGYLANFSLLIENTSICIWYIDFIGLELFSKFAYEIVFAFLQGDAHGT